MHQVSLAPSSTMTFEEAAQIEAITIAYGNAFITFDADAAIQFFADDVAYESQSVLYPLEGVEEVARFLRARWAFFRENLEGVLNIALGKVDVPKGIGHPCLIVMRGNNAEGLVLLKLNNNTQIVRIDLCHVLPQPSDATPIARFPIGVN